MTYEWKVDGVEYELKPSRAPRKPPWLLWRKWRGENNYPEMKIEWFETPADAFEKYPGIQIQSTLGI